MLESNAFFELLFDQGDSTNFCNHLWDAKSIFSADSEVRPVRERFCLNALDPLTDSNPTDPHKHAVDIPRRADHNVTKHRNILIESDAASIAEQIAWINENQLPISAVVFSGKKSLHIIISLEKCVSASRYKVLVKNLYCAISASGLSIDPTCKNPSKLTRYPEVVRSDTGQRQELLYLGKRVSWGQLNTWIKFRLPKEAKLKKKIGDKKNFDTSKRRISQATRQLVEEGILTEPSRHACVLKAASQMRKAGFEINEIEDYLFETTQALIPERPTELSGILTWVQYNIIPELEGE